MFKIGIITKYGVTLGTIGITDFSAIVYAMNKKDTSGFLDTGILYSRYDNKSGPADTPEYLNPKYSLLEGYVLAALIPPMNWGIDVSEWEYKLYSESVPEWYKKDASKYEQMFRDEVKCYMTKNYVFMCGHAWQPIRKWATETEYLYGGSLEIMRFGVGNDYTTSDIRKYLQTSDLLSNLKNTFGDRLSPITVDLSVCPWDEGYGTITGDQISLLTEDDYITIGRYCDQANIFWLATPESTPKNGGAANVWCGKGNWPQTYNSLSRLAVRPCIILKNV